MADRCSAWAAFDAQIEAVREACTRIRRIEATLDLDLDLVSQWWS